MKPDYDRLLNAIDAAEANAYGSDTEGDLSAARASAIARYLGDNTYPAPAGTSQVVSRDVFDTVNWIMPSLTRIFTQSEQICMFEPTGPEDEDAALQESAFTSHCIQRLNPWFQICHDWFTDALLTKNAYAKVYWDTSRQIEKESYERQSEESLQVLLADGTLEVVQHSEYPDPDYQPQPMMGPDGQPVIDPMTGQPVIPPPPMLHDVVVQKVKERGFPHICVLPPERVKVGHRTPSYQLRDCTYFEHWEMKTISQMRAEGFDIPDDIADDEGAEDTEEDQARDQFGEEATRDDEVAQADPSMRLVKARSVWIRHDTDGDGLAELQYCVVVGRSILYREEVSRIPVACIVPSPLPHRHVGISVDDMVSDIQEIKTMMLRQGINNLFLANNPRTIVNEQINLDDMLVSRPGGIVRAEGGGDVRALALPLVTPNIFPQAMQGLEYMDAIRQHRAGVNNYFAGTDAGSLNRTASGVAQLTSSAAQRVEQVARVFATGVEELFSIVHEQILKHGHKAEIIRLRGKWTPVDPRTWKTRQDLRINVGMGTGNREQVMAHLQMIIAMQMQTLPIGVTTPRHIHSSMMELSKAAGFADGSKFFSDPAENPPPPPPPDPKMVEIQQKGQIEMARLQLDRELGLGKLQVEAAKLGESAPMETPEDNSVEYLRLELDKYKAELDAQVKITLEQMKQAGAAQQAAMQGEQQAQQKAQEGQQDAGALSKVLSSLQEQQVQIAQALSTVAKPSAKKVIRDAQGNAVGIDTGSGVQRIRRGPDGRVAGLEPEAE